MINTNLITQKIKFKDAFLSYPEEKFVFACIAFFKDDIDIGVINEYGFSSTFHATYKYENLPLLTLNSLVKISDNLLNKFTKNDIPPTTKKIIVFFKDRWNRDQCMTFKPIKPGFIFDETKFIMTTYHEFNINKDNIIKWFFYKDFYKQILDLMK